MRETTHMRASVQAVALVAAFALFATPAFAVPSETATTTPPIRAITIATATVSQHNLIDAVLRNNFSSNAVPAATDSRA